LAAALPVERGKGKADQAIAGPITQLCTVREAEAAAVSHHLPSRILEEAGQNPTSGAEFACRFAADWTKRTLDPARARV